MSHVVNAICECPNCKATYEISICDGINATLSPQLKEKVVTGELFKHTCPECKFEFVINHKFLYHDIRNNYMIYLIPNSKNNDEEVSQLSENLKMMMDPNRKGNVKKEISSYKFRIVDEFSRLIEKINILDNNINDKVIELCKMVIMFNYLKDMTSSNIKKVIFESKDENVNFLISTSDDKTFKASLPSSVYDEILSNLSASPLYEEDLAFKSVDLIWAADAVQNYHVLNQRH